MVHLLNTVIHCLHFNIKEIGETGLRIIENAVYLLYVSYILYNETCIILDAVTTSDIYWVINHKWALPLIGYLGLDMIELVSKISLYLVWMLWVSGKVAPLSMVHMHANKIKIWLWKSSLEYYHITNIGKTKHASWRVYF